VALSGEVAVAAEVAGFAGAALVITCKRRFPMERMCRSVLLTKTHPKLDSWLEAFHCYESELAA
jgi:hypothetical protein